MALCPVLAKEYPIITIDNIDSLQLSTYDRRPGTKVKVSCLSENFKVSGPTTLTCQSNGAWDTAIPKCINKMEFNASQNKSQTTRNPANPKEAPIKSGSTSSEVDPALAIFSGSIVPYVITVCVLAIMFLGLIFMLTYLIRMRKIMNRKLNDIEEKERRPAHVRAVDSLRSLQSGSATIYDYFRHTDSPTLSASNSSHSTTHKSKYENQWENQGASPLYNANQGASLMYNGNLGTSTFYNENQRMSREHQTPRQEELYANVSPRFKRRQGEYERQHRPYFNSLDQRMRSESNPSRHETVYTLYDPRVKRARSLDVLNTTDSKGYSERFKREMDRDARSLHYETDNDKWYQL